MVEKFTISLKAGKTKRETSHWNSTYWSIKDELLVRGGIVYRNDRIVIPVALRKRLIAKLHQGHMGTESTLRRARTSLWWPSMDNQLKQFIATCEVCNTSQTQNQKEALMSHEIRNRPWSKVGSNIFERQRAVSYTHLTLPTSDLV